MNSFSIARLPRIEFGRGVFSNVPAILELYGKRVLIVTGGRFILETELWIQFLAALKRKNVSWEHCRISNEPSPAIVDEFVNNYRSENFEVVIGIGGGSVLDAAKAIAGLLKINHSVMDYLEGVGPELSYNGPAVPFIAVPTTAGTGSEATKNAVLSLSGRNGFKKSFRHEMLVAEYAVVDPDFLASCPPELIAANGMDALTQLIESYVSINANGITDSLAISGLHAVCSSLVNWYEEGPGATDAHEKMAYAALISGITLAQVGLGSVHGLASPLGAFYPIPHGVVCGTLAAAATQMNIQSMLEREPGNPALAKYVKIGNIINNQVDTGVLASHDRLVAVLTDWIEQFSLPRLNYYGITEADFDDIVAHSRGSSMKTNPILLTNQEISAILRDRL
ncbi:MAG: iron-containing alcohol dehydrogenase [Gammaproteobacteria bacterium]|nr:iron-containing alcohol dehydrogenase [Gammaproteobacteria bacterium]